MLKKQTGFTLIELLVVIVIIGIIAGILIIAINPRAQTDKSKDAIIKIALSGIRTQSALYFSENNDSFMGFDGGIIYNKLDIYPNIKDINVSENFWSVHAQLFTRNAYNNIQFYCVDSAGFSGIRITALGDTDLVCPS